MGRLLWVVGRLVSAAVFLAFSAVILVLVLDDWGHAWGIVALVALLYVFVAGVGWLVRPRRRRRGRHARGWFGWNDGSDGGGDGGGWSGGDGGWGGSDGGDGGGDGGG